MSYDFACLNYGTVAGITALTQRADTWLLENVDAGPSSIRTDGSQFQTILGEPRCMRDIAHAMIEVGFTCEQGAAVGSGRLS